MAGTLKIFILPGMKCWWQIMVIFFCGCAAEKSVFNPKMASLENMPTDSLRAMQQAGFDFTASGQEVLPWQFQMNFDDSMYFENSGGGRFVVRTPQPSVEGKQYFFKTSTVLGATEISISMVACPAENIRIKAGEQLFTGCGQFLYNPQLHGAWEMNAIGSDKLSAATFRLGLPVFQLDLNKMSFAAHDGDNYLNGGMSVIGKRIELRDIRSMGAGKKNKIGREVIDLMNGFLSKYELNGNNLSITLQNDMVVFFNKRFGPIP